LAPALSMERRFDRKRLRRSPSFVSRIRYRAPACFVPGTRLRGARPTSFVGHARSNFAQRLVRAGRSRGSKSPYGEPKRRVSGTTWRRGQRARMGPGADTPISVGRARSGDQGEPWRDRCRTRRGGVG
jgi:hypothetical protein